MPLRATLHVINCDHCGLLPAALNCLHVLSILLVFYNEKCQLMIMIFSLSLLFLCVSRCYVAPFQSQILSCSCGAHDCEIKFRSGLGMRLGVMSIWSSFFSLSVLVLHSSLN